MMAKFDVVNVLGKKIADIELSNKIFDITPHNQAMFDLVLVERAEWRKGNHSTKTRSEVSGGGRKPWRQKGTGRARQGSIRSPQWRGGGIVFGPTPLKNYKLKINKKVKLLAIKSAFSQLAKENKYVFVDNIDFTNPSTKDFTVMLKNFKLDDKKVMLILDNDEKNHNTYLSGRNLNNVFITTIDEIYLNDLLNLDGLIMTKDVAKMIERKYS